MAKYEIRYGLGGGFGGVCEWEESYADSLEDAITEAYEQACEVYDSYDGLHGLQDHESIQEENPDWGDEEVDLEWREQRDSWLEYEARPVSEEVE